VGSIGVAKQQSDLKRSFSQIYQIDLSIFVDRSERSERVKNNAALVIMAQVYIHAFLPPPRRLCICWILSVCLSVCRISRKKLCTDFDKILWRGGVWP